MFREEPEKVHFDHQRRTREGSLRSSERNPRGFTSIIREKLESSLWLSLNSRGFTSIIREELERVHFDHQRETREGSLWSSERNSRGFTSIIREKLERVHFDHQRGTREGSLLSSERNSRVHYDYHWGTREGSLWSSERNSRGFTSIIREKLETRSSKWTLSSSSQMIEVNPLEFLSDDRSEPSRVPLWCSKWTL